MKKRILAGILSGIITVSSMGILGSAALDSADLNFFLEKIASTQDEDKRKMGVEILRMYVGTDTPNISSLKTFIKDNASTEDIRKIEANGYTLNTALSSLDILGKMTLSDRQSLLKAMETGDVNSMKEIMKKQDITGTPSGGGGVVVPPVLAPQIPIAELPPVQELPMIKFKDIESHWAKEAIEALVAKGIIKGQAEDRFNPNGKITRAEFTALIVRLFDLKLGDTEQNINFVDVKTGNWYYDIVKIGSQQGIVKGVGSEQFAPNKEITREQMVTILMKALKTKVQLDNEIQGIDMAKFQDRAEISEWAMEYVSEAVKRSIVKGKTDTLLDPKGLATRAESAAMILQVYNLYLSNK